MPYVVHAESPEQLSWSQFIREPYVIKKGFVLAGLPALRARRIRPTSESREFGRFRLHLGRYDINPVRNSLKERLHGVPVAATLDGELVGAVNAFNLWVHPACREDSLATEMIVERFRYEPSGSAVWRSAIPVPMLYTPEGFNTLRASYREMVKRNLVDPGPAGCP